MATTSVLATDLRRDLFATIKRVVLEHRPIMIRRGGAEIAAIVPADMVRQPVPSPTTKPNPDKTKLADFCDHWGVREICLFGSILRDDFRPDSDVDVMIDLRDDAVVGAATFAEMTDALENIFGRRVDLVTKAGVMRSRNERRRATILGEAKTVHHAA